MQDDPDTPYLNRATSSASRTATGTTGVRTLSEGTAMSRLELSEVRLGTDSTARVSSPIGGEAFVYVLAGKGTLSRGDENIEIGQGDFIGLKALEEAALHNPFEPDLVYLSGGEKSSHPSYPVS